MEGNALSYPVQKNIIMYMEFEKRLLLSQSNAAFAKLERQIPLMIGKLTLFPYHLAIDNIEYFVKENPEYRNDTTLPFYLIEARRDSVIVATYLSPEEHIRNLMNRLIGNLFAGRSLLIADVIEAQFLPVLPDGLTIECQKFFAGGMYHEETTQVFERHFCRWPQEISFFSPGGRDPIFDLDMVQNVKSLHIIDLGRYRCNLFVMNSAKKLYNEHIFVDSNHVKVEDMVDVTNVWISDGRKIGTTFTVRVNRGRVRDAIFVALVDQFEGRRIEIDYPENENPVLRHALVIPMRGEREIFISTSVRRWTSRHGNRKKHWRIKMEVRAVENNI